MPPQISVSKIAQYLKGKTARKLMQEFPNLNKQFWGQRFWSRGYFAATSGAITDEMIMEYIENQDDDAEKRGDSFTVLDAQLQDFSPLFMCQLNPPAFSRWWFS